MNLFDPTTSQHHKSGGWGGGGGVHGKKRENFTVSQLSALATRTPSLGRVSQGAWELGFTQTRRRNVLSDPSVFGYTF